MNWLNKFVEQHEDLESPQSFWRWAGLAAISAVVKDNVWMDRQIFKTYPNIYVMLHADSGLKKGPPVSVARQLVSKVNNTKIIGGRSSIQGILKKLGTTETQKGGIISPKSVAFICSSELSSSIVEDKVATKILTDLYDRSYNIGEWQSLLKMEEFTLVDPTVTMLTATNESMAGDFLTKSAIKGGYIARTFIVYEKTGTVDNSLIYPMRSTPNYDEAALYLKRIANLKGAFYPLASLVESDEYPFKRIKQEREVWFNSTGIIYEDWYMQFKKYIRETTSKDTTGTLNRFGDSVLKVAMLIALAEGPELVISENAMRTAITECEKLLGNVRQTTLGKEGDATLAELKVMMINEILWRDPPEVTRDYLMRIMFSYYNAISEFDDVVNSLIAPGLLAQVNRGNQIFYVMVDKEVNELRRFMNGKGIL